MSDTVEQDGAPMTRPAEAVALVDADVHLYAPDGVSSIYPYMPKAWAERFKLKGLETSTFVLSSRFNHPTNSAMRGDAAPPSGATPGSDLAFMRENFLDPVGIDIAIATSLQAGAFANALAGPDESVVLCSAFNDYFLDEWMPEDKRLRYLIAVSPQDPVASAAEIRRVGDRDAVVGVFIAPINIALGNRHYAPIYAAAAELDLPIYLHVTGAEMVYQGSAEPGGGFPESYSERRSLFAQLGEINLTSLVFSGTLARYPTLKFVFSEFGFTWAAPQIWRMDTTWKMTRVEVPWVKRWPSEYVADQIRLTTQPLDEPRRPKDLDRMIEMLGPEILMFSTDYPHWDADDPHKVLRSVAPEVRGRLYAGTALETFRRLPSSLGS